MRLFFFRLKEPFNFSMNERDNCLRKRMMARAVGEKLVSVGFWEDGNIGKEGLILT